MCIRLITILLILLSLSSHLIAQTGSVSGSVRLEGEGLEYATVLINGSSLGATTNMKGNYRIQNIPYGTYELTASYLGYKPITKKIRLSQENPSLPVGFSPNE